MKRVDVQSEEDPGNSKLQLLLLSYTVPLNAHFTACLSAQSSAL